ncbi:MAG: hypothetical protein K8Q97_03150 [Candidatus Andersenbacteria bacterium]|nr:hypothetical protein [Candidatus Andersenbacteria bacterium]
MKNFIEKKIRDIQQQPDNVRARTVLIFTVCATIVVVLMWVALLLPAQLRIAVH